VIVEPVDENYQTAESGKPSHTVLITNLVNRVQPIIRYDLGDSITMYPTADTCPCGRNFPSMKVEGRTNDILRLVDAAGEKVPILPLAIATEVEEIPGVRRFQVIQTQPSILTLRLESDPEFDQEAVWSNVIYSLSDYLNLHDLSNINIQKSGEPPHRDPKSGKFRQVWSEVK
jgi:phenylacetate-coenzyme A ligase PaaK-like adenylate-forming protein